MSRTGKATHYKFVDILRNPAFVATGAGDWSGVLAVDRSPGDWSTVDCWWSLSTCYTSFSFRWLYNFCYVVTHFRFQVG